MLKPTVRNGNKSVLSRLQFGSKLVVIVSVRAEKTTVQIRNLCIDFLTSKLTLTARLIGIQELKEQRLEGIVILVAACLYRVESKHTFGNQRNAVFALLV